MNFKYLTLGAVFVLHLLSSDTVSGQQTANQEKISLNDLSAFKDPGKSWSVAGGVTANLNEKNLLTTRSGTGILVNLPTANTKGVDLLTTSSYGDLVLELDYMMAKGSNSGIYLEGIYEVQLEDSWGVKNPGSSNNGGVYERWNNSKPEGEQGYEGYAPRQNVSKAPGLWQHIKIAFQAPRFDASGTKTANARFIRVELNGVMIHENVELSGPTRGANGPEKATGALRLQGDHGAVAFRNITVSPLPASNGLNTQQRAENDADPIYIDVASTPNIRSFIDIAGGKKVVHAISVGSTQQVHYSYDLDNGALFQAWHGEFIDATPMWHDRGNGTSYPRGSQVIFMKSPRPVLARLTGDQAPWPTDTSGSGFVPKGYILDAADRPVFTYRIFNTRVEDAIKVVDNGHGFSREITLKDPSEKIFALVANATSIDKVSEGLYVADDQSYYIQFPDNVKPVIREVNGKKELIVPVIGKLTYSILF
ncbi:MAG: DUF1080 domain-containing protein [Chitinophagaceae bacterium]|nr:DUF1080 domain-containing protein [Chitinophagaceae bacterium]